jgi:hypothetical protein
MRVERATAKKPAIIQMRSDVGQANVEWMDFQPFPKAIRDGLSLQHHLHLAALRAGAGSLLSLQLMMRVALTSAILNELGYGQPLSMAADAYEYLAAAALNAGSEGRYMLDAPAFAAFAHLLIYHDRQLETAPLKAFAYAAEKLDQYSRQD